MRHRVLTAVGVLGQLVPEQLLTSLSYWDCGVLGCDQLGAKMCTRISVRGRVVVVVSLLLRCCANKNLCREDICAAATRGKKNSSQKIFMREKIKLVKTKITAVKLLT